MPQKTWVVGEEVLAADFNNYVQNQTVPAFASVAQRDAQWTGPPAGAVCVTTDTGSFWQRIGAVWWKPFGRAGYAERTSNAGPQGAEAAAGVSITVTVPAGRLLRLETGVRAINNSASNGGAFLRIKEGSTVIYETYYIARADLAGNGGMMGRTISPTAGAHTYGIYLEGNPGTATIIASTSYPCWLEAIDMGAA